MGIGTDEVWNEMATCIQQVSKNILWKSEGNRRHCNDNKDENAKMDV